MTFSTCRFQRLFSSARGLVHFVCIFQTAPFLVGLGEPVWKDSLGWFIQQRGPNYRCALTSRDEARAMSLAAPPDVISVDLYEQGEWVLQSKYSWKVFLCFIMAVLFVMLLGEVEQEE